MSFRIVNREFAVEVADEEPLDHVNNPNGQKFIPVIARVTFWEDQIKVAVQGPLLNKAGKALKTFGMASFDQQDIVEQTAPAWLLDAVKQVQH